MTKWLTEVFGQECCSVFSLFQAMLVLLEMKLNRKATDHFAENRWCQLG